MACVPTEFTYCADEACSVGGNGSGGAGGGPSELCGNGELDAGEECDEGELNSDDLADESSAQTEMGPRGCSRTCRHLVQWTRVHAVIENSNTQQAAYFAVSASQGQVVAGGAWIAGDTTDMLDRERLHFSGRRLIDGYTSEGEPTFVIDTNDAGVSNAVFGITALADGTQMYLESLHESGVERGRFVRQRDGASTVMTTPRITFNESFAAIGPNNDANGVYMVMFEQAGVVRLLHVGANDSSPNDLGLDAGVGFTGEGPGGVAALEDDVVIAWGNRVARVNTVGSALWTVDVSNAELTGVCARPDGSIAVSGWSADGDGGYDAIVAWLEGGAGDLIDSVVLDGSAGGVDGANAIACDSDGSVVVVGEEALDGSMHPLTPNSRAWLRRYGAEGELVWTRSHESSLGGAGVSDSDAFAVALDEQGFVYVAGRTMTTSDTASAWLRRYAP